MRLFATRAVAHGLGDLSFSRESSIDPLYRAANVKPASTSFMSYKNSNSKLVPCSQSFDFIVK